MNKQNEHERPSLSPVEGGGCKPTSEAGEREKNPKRFRAKHKSEVVLRLLRGEDLEILSRELGLTAANVSQWRDAFLAGGAESLKKRSPEEEAKYKHLNARIGEQTMEIELLREKIRLLEAKDPLACRRSRK